MPSHPAHIAMIGTPIVSHVLPSLELIRELVTRGHRVTYANDPAVADLITEAGAELIACTSMLPVADNTWPEDPVAVMNLFLDNAQLAASSATSPPMSKCTPGFPSGRSCNAPTPSSPTSAWAAAARDCWRVSR
ncbi:hypothetical protein ACWF99_02330 [Nocardia sp. NPDC055002]